ncbi:MAG: DUF3102 domain-containing protein [Ruminococcaceae bacterium]|nr:DUF3102 domain-containing protein [Oscillospiraceae bacterium]
MRELSKTEAGVLRIDEEDIESFNELLAEEEAEKIACEINAIKRTTAQNVLASAIEIGRLLCEAKQRVSHGEWGAWLRDNVSYSVSNANNMMRLYREREKMQQIDLFGNNDLNMFEGLSLSHAIALLDVPAEERREFIEENNVSEMSVRELQAAIRAKEEAEEREKEALSEAEELKRQNEQMEEAIAEANDELFALKTSAQGLKDDERKQLEAELKAKYKAEADKKIEAAKKAADKKLEEAKKQSDEAAKKVLSDFEKEKEEIRRAEREKAEKESTERISALETQLRSAAIAASPLLTEFKVRMEAFQGEYRRMVEIVERAEADQLPEAGNLRAVLSKITEALK